jgi:exodeoxyribonuclease V beta subunit
MVFDGELKIIDLLVQKENKLYIFDYKTTKEQLVEHEKQVSYYNKAIKDIYKTDDVSSCIIYLKNDDVQLKFI